MDARRRAATRRSQQGFSMVELLLTAFILAVGIMGLSMLQILSLKASRGGRSLSTAVLVADKVMDQVEMEGRLTWLNITASQYSTPAILTTKYVNSAAAVVDTFTIKGKPLDAVATDPVDNTAFFTVTTQRVNAAVGAAVTGAMHDYNVTVTFSDATDATTNLPVTRTVRLTRRILHG